MNAIPQSFLDATFTDVTTAIALIQTALPLGAGWTNISISNCTDQILEISLSAANDINIRIPSLGSERMEDIHIFIEVFGKIAAAGTGEVIINVW